MSDVVIKVDNLNKKYILSHQSQEKYTALRDVMANGAKNLGKKLLSPFTPSTSLRAGLHSSQSTNSPFTLHPSQDSQEDFYALRDISFEIKQGDRVGIIGRNGAGKSTLLKILSRITEPTSGRIEITGRVASLLEVGTGFHPELTGRENIFLNGAILGMGKAEIKRKFDEIVAFAEVERFLDTPVKRYSSGMYVRLAFAVAAHLEPEILIVDEVLAVGDAQFQKKCLGKMEEVGREGRTVIFVSHNMAAISNLCSTGICLKNGCVDIIGGVDLCINQYMAGLSDSIEKIVDLASLKRNAVGSTKMNAMLKTIELITDNTITPWLVPFEINPKFKIKIEVSKKIESLELGIAIYNNSFVEIASSLSTDSLTINTITPGEYEIIAEINNLRLLPGTYILGLGLRSGQSDIIMEDYIREAVYFEVTPSEASAECRAHTRRGALIPDVNYTIT